jgi:hypothetical protein
LPFSNKFIALSQKINNRAPLGGVIYGYLFLLIFFVFCTLIGMFFIPIGGMWPRRELQNYNYTYSSNIFNFMDIISN